jgi:hypothetical protein
MHKSILAAAIVSIGALGLAGCDVKKTQSADVTVPKYEVTKTQEGNVTPPKFEVTGPDVKVGSTEATVKVPTVKTEEKQITVPTVDVTTGKEKEAQKQAAAKP